MILVNGFYQSKELCPADQKYYTAARQYLKDNGLRRFAEYIWQAIENPPAGLDVTQLQFETVLWLALDDYHYIIFNPLTFKNDN